MIGYERIVLPILKKHIKNTTHDLIIDLCNIKDCFCGNGYIWCDTIFHVEQTDGLGRKYIQRYSGYSNLSQKNAMKADKVSIVDYAGKLN